MLDLSPEKLLVLLSVGLVVLGPHKLPLAARSVAQNLVKARRLANGLLSPLQDSLAQPRQEVQNTLAEFRSAVNGPVQEIRSTMATGRPAGTVDAHGAAARGDEQSAVPPLDPSRN